MLPASWVLVTWRGSDPSPPAPFNEAYFCATCGDYFGLALVPGAQPKSADVSVVAALDGPPPPTEVYCPRCGTAYPQYGVVGGGLLAEPPMVRELLVTTFPLGAPRAREVRVGDLSIERLVLLVAGPLPPSDALVDFAAAAVDAMIRGTLRTVVRGGSVPLHLLELSSLSDETEWLSALLDAHVYRGSLGARVFGSLGPFEAERGTRSLLCAISPAGPLR